MAEQKKAIFICGCGRSGTTLLGSLLGAANGCITTPESQFITETAAQLSKNEIADQGDALQRAFLDSFRFRLWNISDAVQEISELPSQDVLARLIWQCVDLYAQKNGKQHWHTWIDHTPAHIHHIPLLSRLFPNSYFIHLIRDGRGVFSSTKSLEWGPAGAIQATQWWTHSLAPGLAAENAFSEQVIRVRFENLIQDTEYELRRICKLTEVEFSPSMLQGGGFILPEYTQNQHQLIGGPPELSVCTKWKEILSAREVEIFESLCGALLQYLGYELVYGYKARRPSRTEIYKELFIKKLIKKMFFLLEYYRRWKTIPLV